MAINVVREGSATASMKTWFQRIKVTATVMLPFVLACVLLNCALWQRTDFSEEPTWLWAGVGAAFYFVVWGMVAILALGRRLWRRSHGKPKKLYGFHPGPAAVLASGGRGRRLPVAGLRYVAEPAPGLEQLELGGDRFRQRSADGDHFADGHAAYRTSGARLHGRRAGMVGATRRVPDAHHSGLALAGGNGCICAACAALGAVGVAKLALHFDQRGAVVGGAQLSGAESGSQRPNQRQRGECCAGSEEWRYTL